MGLRQDDQLALNLVNVRLVFSARNQFATRGRTHRGRGQGGGSRGRPYKRSQGIQLIEDDKAFVHGTKRRLNLVDDTSDSISAVAPHAMKILSWNC
ncbi:UNVERIFIED_CONTAM: hypothetical protein Slati_0837700 [Sesamum latifolium]|uniref:Uncharacterized protein n=1 Tax=Sesamum latifolium TaxID=2727402 RepID=A0AAW2XN37_9LAMI